MNQQTPIHSSEQKLRNDISAATWRCEKALKAKMQNDLRLDGAAWDKISASSSSLMEQLRANTNIPLIDQFLTEYGLSSDEGVQLMRLAEALSRTTDPVTANELIRDKLKGRRWLSHAGSGHTLAMSLSGRALHLTDKWLQWTKNARNPLAKTGNAKLRFATRTAIKALSSQFVFAETLDQALKRAKQYGQTGYLFSFDMLGEAARTMSDAEKYYAAYTQALDKVAQNAQSHDPRFNHGISIKLSALHPRYEYAQAKHVVPQIARKLLTLAIKAKKANVQITIDAEETERLDISMDVLAALIASPELRGWQGLGFVVQAYQRRALPLLDWLTEKSRQLEAPLFIRLVKGAYWDSEIKRAQEMGLESYPVFTRKEMTDLSYLACAQKLLDHPDCFHPQFATHNAYSAAAVQELAGNDHDIEFQRLFGMGQQLHDIILTQPNASSRIYAPVGTQKDLLSYLIRRLLENGANSSFVNKLADQDIPLFTLARDPVTELTQYQSVTNDIIPKPRRYLLGTREIAAGWDLSNPEIQSRFKKGLNHAAQDTFLAAPNIIGEEATGDQQAVANPAMLHEVIGHVVSADEKQAETAVEAANLAFKGWSSRPVSERAAALEKAADLLELRAGTFHYLAVKEAGKTWSDAIDEVREAVDFCRYYAQQARAASFADREALGVTICISPWNFPLAIFLGQITAALAAGNTVVAKPAEQTPLIAAEAVRLLHDAGIDPAAINLVPGDGAHIGEALISNPAVAAVCFTGSTATAKRIASRLADQGRALTPLIAETGGINAMIVDSSALLEQTVDDVVSSAFQSAGQRCSALRVLCVQEDIADAFMELLSGAMDALRIGNPDQMDCDIGPVIDADAKQNIVSHIKRLDEIGRKVGETTTGLIPEGHFIRPVAYELDRFSDIDREIFGPVLHIVRFSAHEKMGMIDKINNSGFGLTLGIHSRIDSICDAMAKQAHVGNIYINRNQIGAVVGVQPFGGQGMSGTGPKAGGPLYLPRLSKKIGSKIDISNKPVAVTDSDDKTILGDLSRAVSDGIAAYNETDGGFPSDEVITTLARDIGSEFGELIGRELQSRKHLLTNDGALASPAGETNAYHLQGRGLIISVMQDDDAILVACARAIVTGNSFLQIDQGGSTSDIDPVFTAINRTIGIDRFVQRTISTLDDLTSQLQDAPFGALITEPNDANIKAIGVAIASRKGSIPPILTMADTHDRFVHEKTITRNIAAAGGDVSLLNA
ncbi:bifunctional proline dehydrogenase/L-glutamate gamma-semialdehyde dehydrogenase PutA [Parasphingorhabdus cellanae]|uniref:Bifunctional protein PutA n=1 Tax=Parasphingorhabdus cellanae TaxID=2806553 RepID=A0ABX7T389_9SPHN|nr:bifunctional proline dehydrogenase/L-glutamate gamma-semialdehyde dehydrogenase PutA [Parasphingorhabdus cellanae]QTD56034.1 bifunctional proline dehydrogenase/L-glutamate gamma-semialdehyde dehydrogenase PutA [Parasphingorhabdus cellanae]